MSENLNQTYVKRRRPHANPKWVVEQLRAWASDQREREAWGDIDRGTYRYCAELLEAAVAHLTGTAHNEVNAQ